MAPRGLPSRLPKSTLAGAWRPSQKGRSRGTFFIIVVRQQINRRCASARRVDTPASVPAGAAASAPSKPSCDFRASPACRISAGFEQLSKADSQQPNEAVGLPPCCMPAAWRCPPLSSARLFEECCRIAAPGFPRPLLPFAACSWTKRSAEYGVGLTQLGRLACGKVVGQQERASRNVVAVWLVVLYSSEQCPSGRVECLADRQSRCSSGCEIASCIPNPACAAGWVYQVMPAAMPLACVRPIRSSYQLQC
jgi:hypothetical protein